jgi:hypothetical protein
MTTYGNPDRSQHDSPVVPDFAALEARAAARSPEDDAERQARLDSWEIGTAAMALGEQHLAAGNVATARYWFEMAATHNAPDAHVRLDTVAVLADTICEATLLASDTPVATEKREPRHEHEDVMERLDAAAEIIRAAEARGELIIALAQAQAQRIFAQSRAATSKATRALRRTVRAAS